MLINFGGTLANLARLGVDTSGGASFSRSLVQGGFLNDPAFGGAGDTTLASLAPNSIYAFLVPESDIVSGTFDVSADGATPLSASLPFGGVAYLTAAPEPASLTLLALGTALPLLRRRKTN